MTNLHERAEAVLDQMRAHRSVRRFLAEEMPDAELATACAAAQMASTSSYIQAYSALRVRDPETRARLAELTGGQPQVAEAGAFLVILGDVRRHALLAKEAGRGLARNLESFLLAVIDASLFAQNLALALESMGYGICYIGGLRTKLPEVDTLLQLPDDVFPLFGLCAGRPAELAKGDPATPQHRPRLPLGAMLFDDHYPSDTDMLAAIGTFDAEVAEHYAARGKPGYNWSGGLVRRLEKPIREHLASYYHSKGARLE